jgi:hypothetical protein
MQETHYLRSSKDPHLRFWQQLPRKMSMEAAAAAVSGWLTG